MGPKSLIILTVAVIVGLYQVFTVPISAVQTFARARLHIFFIIAMEI